MKWLKAFLFILTCFGLMMTTNKVRFRYDWENAFWRTLMTPFVGTIWAEGFSEERFAKVRVGMSFDEVAHILDEPLRKDCSQKGCGWIYSNQDTGTADYDRRWITFDVTGLVDGLRHEFYID
ncbi:MAG: hypothetical protein AB1540_15505 [Bdellovibrionota bacterium]